jgi:hypothetical protein
MPFTFIGSKYINSKPLNPKGFEYLKSNNPPEDATFIDLGSFATRILNPEEEVIEIKNFFTPVEKGKYPKTVKYVELEGNSFLYGQDAIDYAKLQHIHIKEIFKGKKCYFDEVDTFKFVEDILLKNVKTKKIIMNEQDTVVEGMINEFCSKNGFEVLFVDSLLAQFNSTYPVNDFINGLLIDIGYGNIEIMFCYHGKVFEKKTDFLGTKTINPLINSADTLETELLLKEINQEINVLADDGSNSLYRFFYEELISTTISSYYEELMSKNFNKFIEVGMPVYISGGVVEMEGIKQLTVNLIENFFKEKGKQINLVIINNDRLSLLEGLYKKR